MNPHSTEGYETRKEASEARHELAGNWTNVLLQHQRDTNARFASVEKKVDDIVEHRDTIILTEHKVTELTEKVDVMNGKLDKFIDKADTKYASAESHKLLAEQFTFWRNILISGILIVIFIGIFQILFLNSLAK